MDNGFRAWLIEEELSENTISSYLFAVNEYQENYGEVTKENLLKWKAGLMEKHSPKTVNLRLCAMDRYIQYQGIDMKKLKRIKIQKQTSVENSMTLDLFNRLIEGLRQDGQTIWIAYYNLLAKTGARISEALAFTKSDLDRGYAELYTKNKVRRIYFPTELLKEIEAEFRNMDSDAILICNKHGKPMSSRGFANMMKTHAERYGIPKEKMHPHALRHMFAVEFLKRNSDISLLADLLGHSGVNTTMIYTRKSAEEQKAMLDKAVCW